MTKQLSAAHAAALKAGLEAAKANGKTPQQIGHERALQALRWVHLFGWSTASLLEQLVSTNRGGLAAKLVKQGLLKKHLSPGGGGIKGAPLAVLTLTAAGEAYVTRYADSIDELNTYSPSIGWAQLRHDCLVQQLAIQALAAANGPMRIISDREARSRGIAGKIHDLVLIEDAGDIRIRTLIEVELTAKRGRELDTFVLGCCQSMLNAEEAGDEAVLHLYSDSPALLRHYKQRLKPGAEFHTWKRDNSGHWQPHERWQVPERFTENMYFHNIT